MNSGSMATINMSPEDFVDSKNIQNKAMVIDNLLEDGLDYAPRIKGWLKRVLELEVKKEDGLQNAASIGPEAEFWIRLVKALGKDVHREDIREMFGRLYKKSIEPSGLFYALESGLVASIDDDLEEIRKWAVDCLLEKGRLKTAAEIERFLISLLIDEKVPYYLKQEASLALGSRATEQAKKALQGYAAKLIRNPGKDLYGQTINNILKESVAQGIGLTGDETAVRRLTALQIFSDDIDVKNAARYAIEKIRLMAGKDLVHPEFPERAGANDRADSRYRIKIAASMPEKSKAMITTDESGKYEFELEFEPEFTRVVLHSTAELTIPEKIRITVGTNLGDTPELKSMLTRRQDDLEMYGYIDVKLVPDSINYIKVNRQ